MESSEGDTLLQCLEISSTSDSYYLPLRPSKLHPKCRSSYRRRFLRNNNLSTTFPNPRNMQSPSVALSKTNNN